MMEFVDCRNPEGCTKAGVFDLINPPKLVPIPRLCLPHLSGSRKCHICSSAIMWLSLNLALGRANTLEPRRL